MRFATGYTFRLLRRAEGGGGESFPDANVVKRRERGKRERERERERREPLRHPTNDPSLS